MSCGYDGCHFGATYPDGMCIDGYLWDADSCDEPGGDLTVGGDEPCPCCNTREYLGYHDVIGSGNARQRRVYVRAMAREFKARAKGRMTYPQGA